MGVGAPLDRLAAEAHLQRQRVADLGDLVGVKVRVKVRVKVGVKVRVGVGVGLGLG